MKSIVHLLQTKSLTDVQNPFVGARHDVFWLSITNNKLSLVTHSFLSDKLFLKSFYKCKQCAINIAIEYCSDMEVSLCAVGRI